MSRFRCLALLTSAVAFPCLGQQTTATIVGHTTDTSGAVLRSVQIRAVHLATNAVREVVTDATGSYSIPFVPAGDYSISASLTGFQGQKVDQVSLQVQQTARVDFTLKVGDVAETVEVSASASVLQTENATVGTVIDAQKIVDLPLNGRNFVQLAQLIPGVQAGTPGSITVRRGRGSIGQQDSPFGSTGMSANGSRDTANRYFIDGVEFMDYDAMTYAFSPSVDSIAEFKVETSSYSAESGGAPGGHVNMLTKRGGNRYHGTLWEFNRNDALTQTYDAIANKSTTPPRLNRNQFGANVGGPLTIPKVYSGQDKTFFFFNWESGRLAQGGIPTPLIVPPTEMRSGDFRNLVNARTGTPIILKDPLGIGIVNNVIPKAALSPQSLAFLEFEPQPNAQVGAFNYRTGAFSAVSRQNNYNGRVDHNFSSKDIISGRYIFNDTYEAGVPFWGHDERNNLGRSQNWAFSYIHMFSGNVINEFRGGWHRFSESEIFGTTNNAAFDVVGLMKLPLVSRLPQEYGPPTINVSGSDGGFSMYNLQRQIGPRDRSNSINPYSDTLSWQHGSHFLKFGADISRRGVTFEQARAPRGSFTFDGTYTGSALADFMLGYVRSANLNPAHTSTDLHNTWQSYFVNDDWKVSQRLTLNFGLRYDYFPPYTQSNDKIVDIEQNGFAVTGFATPKTSKYGRGLLQPDKNDLGPRFGFAWRPAFLGADSVIRGGYGIYYTPEISNVIFAMVEGAQATAGADVAGNISGAPSVFFNNPFESAKTSGDFNFAVSVDQNIRDSYVQQWNFNVQRKMPANVVLDIGYVGSKGTRLAITIPDLNRPLTIVDPTIPGLPSLNARRPNQAYQRAVQSDKSIGNSIYHSLQVKAERRLSKGLTFLTAYTWSKAISGPSDIGGQVGGGSFIGSIQDIFNMTNERSVSGFDLPHRFVQTVIYDVPFFRSAHGFVKYALDGWQASTIVTLQSGFPAPISYGVDTTGTGQGSRPDVVAGQNGNLPGDKRTWARWFNTSAFAIPPNGRFGTAGRTNNIRLPGLINADFSINKQFRFSENRAFEFRTEVFNLLNHFNPDPNTVDRNIRSATFGSIGGGVQGVTTRVIQLGAKLNF